MSISVRWFAVVPLALAASGSGQSRDTTGSLFDAVVGCQSVTDPSERVRCYDRTVTAMRQAREKREIAVVDRAEVRATKRSLFGLTLPRLPALAGADDGREITEIMATIASAAIDRGGWAIRLSDGSNWQQVDEVELGRRPRAGDSVVVRRAALGSFRMTIARYPGFRVRRIA